MQLIMPNISVFLLATKCPQNSFSSPGYEQFDMVVSVGRRISCRCFITSAESTRWIDSEVSVSEGALEVVSLVILCSVSIVVSAINATVGPTGGALLAAIAFFVPAPATIPVHAAVSMASSIFRLSQLYHYVNWIAVVAFSVGGLLGALCAAPLISITPPPFLQIVIGLFIIVSANVGSAQRESWRGLSSYRIVTFGWLISFISMFVGATSALIAPISYRLSASRQETIANQTAIVLSQHVIKLVGFGILGYGIENYAVPIVLMICGTFLGTYIGTRFLHHLSEQLFQRLFRIALSIAGLTLILKACFSYI